MAGYWLFFSFRELYRIPIHIHIKRHASQSMVMPVSLVMWLSVGLHGPIYDMSPYIPDDPKTIGFCGYHGYVVMSYSPYIPDDPQIIGYCGYHGYMVMRYICVLYSFPYT